MMGPEEMCRWIRDLGTSLGIPLDLDGDGACAIRLDNGIECVIELHPDDGKLYVHARLAEARGAARTRMLEEALALNLHGLATRGTWLALDRAHDSIVHCWTAALDSLGTDQLTAIFADFVELAAELKEQLVSRGEPEAVDSDAQLPMFQPWNPAMIRA